jgi:hypothetical protein
VKLGLVFLQHSDDRGSEQIDRSAQHLSLTYRQGGVVAGVTADKPNLPLYEAEYPSIVRWSREPSDQRGFSNLFAGAIAQRQVLSAGTL